MLPGLVADFWFRSGLSLCWTLRPQPRVSFSLASTLVIVLERTFSAPLERESFDDRCLRISSSPVTFVFALFRLEFLSLSLSLSPGRVLLLSCKKILLLVFQNV